VNTVTVTVTADPASIVADGASTSVITAAVTDASSNLLAGQPVTFTTTLGTLAPVVINTDSSGVAITTLTAGITPGVALITA
jgi:adhesin/invasin